MAKEVRFWGWLHRVFLPRLRPWNYRLFVSLYAWFMPPWLFRRTTRKAIRVEREDGTKLKCYIYVPKNPKSDLMTGVMFIHGGGYCIGSVAEIGAYLHRITKRDDAVVISPKYRLAYSRPYPAALEDCRLALHYFYDHCEDFRVNPHQIFIMGVSAGGGLTAALCFAERDDHGVPIAGQFPIYPMLDDRFTATNQDNDAPVWNTKNNVAAWKTYLRDDYGGEVSCYAAPARAEDVSALPPLVSYVGTIDPFYEEDTKFFHRLEEAGVEVHFKTYEGCFHAFDTMTGNSPQSRDALQYLEERFVYAQKNWFTK